MSEDHNTGANPQNPSGGQRSKSRSHFRSQQRAVTTHRACKSGFGRIVGDARE